MAYWQQVMLPPLCHSSSTFPSLHFIVFRPTDITQVTKCSLPLKPLE